MAFRSWLWESFVERFRWEPCVTSISVKERVYGGLHERTRVCALTSDPHHLLSPLSHFHTQLQALSFIQKPTSREKPPHTPKLFAKNTLPNELHPSFRFDRSVWVNLLSLTLRSYHNIKGVWSEQVKSRKKRRIYKKKRKLLSIVIRESRTCILCLSIVSFTVIVYIYRA